MKKLIVNFHFAHSTNNNSFWAQAPYRNEFENLLAGDAIQVAGRTAILISSKWVSEEEAANYRWIATVHPKRHGRKATPLWVYHNRIKKLALMQRFTISEAAANSYRESFKGNKDVSYEDMLFKLCRNLVLAMPNVVNQEKESYGYSAFYGYMLILVDCVHAEILDVIPMKKLPRSWMHQPISKIVNRKKEVTERMLALKEIEKREKEVAK